MSISKNDFRSFAEKSPNLTLDDELMSAKIFQTTILHYLRTVLESNRAGVDVVGLSGSLEFIGLQLHDVVVVGH